MWGTQKVRVGISCLQCTISVTLWWLEFRLYLYLIFFKIQALTWHDMKSMQFSLITSDKFFFSDFRVLELRQFSESFREHMHDISMIYRIIPSFSNHRTCILSFFFTVYFFFHLAGHSPFRFLILLGRHPFSPLAVLFLSSTRVGSATAGFRDPRPGPSSQKLVSRGVTELCDVQHFLSTRIATSSNASIHYIKNRK